jgi:hypothetical protein
MHTSLLEAVKDAYDKYDQEPSVVMRTKRTSKKKKNDWKDINMRLIMI